MIPRLLFVMKRRDHHWGDHCYSHSMSSGLFNSVRFIIDMLRRHGVDANAEQAIDNNCIDRLVTKHRPTHVIIEAFWVVPEKFDVLKPLHRSVRWIVRNHSEIPFLANEGIAIGWARDYMRRGVEVMSNAPRAVQAMRTLATANDLSELLATYGPNVYPEPASSGIGPHLNRSGPVINIGCFGAVRPLKNQLQQAFAAIEFGDALGKQVRFHINGARLEGGGGHILKNLRALFSDAHGHQLVEHPWCKRDEFLALVGAMDIVMQVSYSETFNIIAADAMMQSVPVVVSPDVRWLGSYARADPNRPDQIIALMLQIWEENPFWAEHRLHQQRRDLLTHCRAAAGVWLDRFPPRQRMSPAAV